MLKFPNEDDRTTEIQKNLSKQFGFCEHIYKFWVEAEKDEWVEKAGVHPQVCLVVGLLNVQAFRLFRAAFEECKRGEAFAARILSRSLFETVIALLFVLKPVVCIRLKAMTKGNVRRVDEDGRPGTSVVGIRASNAKKTDRLSREFRALLYLAHAFLELEGFEKDFATTYGLKKFHRKANVRVNQVEVKQIESEIGLEWSYVLRNRPYTYSGLNVRSLAALLDWQMLKWYDTIYGFQSRDVHAANGLDHFVFSGNRNGELNPISTDEDVLHVLQGISIQFRGLMQIMEDNIGFGAGNPSSLAWFNKEYERVFERKKGRRPAPGK